MPTKDLTRDDEHDISQGIQAGFNQLNAPIEVIDTTTREEDGYLYATYTLRIKTQFILDHPDLIQEWMKRLGINPMKVTE